MKRLFALMLASLALTSAASAATIMLGKYKHPEDQAFKTFNSMHLDGIKEGLSMYNAYLKTTNSTPLFCLPPNTNITVERAEQIMLGAAKHFQNPDDRPISLLLLIGLTETFPCR